jgi:uncharacterized repeat protein (TIGR02543 family)
MNNGVKIMKNMKYNILFGIALVCAMLFTVCENITDTQENQTPVKSGYGRISISLTGEGAALQTPKLSMARTVLPTLDFDKYVYTFIKDYETTGEQIEPDDDGFFTLEVGGYTVEVQAYTGTEEPYTLAASGVSEPFSVGSGSNAQISVPLSVVDSEAKGKFIYTITYPQDAVAEITLQSWLESDDVPLNSEITQTELTRTREVRIDMYNAYGWGWYNNDALRINVNGVDIANVRVQSGYTNTYTFNVTTGDVIAIYWVVSPGYQEGNSFIVYYTDTPPSPAFNTASWDGSNALIYRNTMHNVSNGTLLGSFTGIGTHVNVEKETETLELDAGSYLFTILVSKDGLYSGITESVLINSSLTTVYTKNFFDDDLITLRTPLVSDYDVVYDEDTQTISVTSKEDASPGTITIYYEGAGATVYEKTTIAPVGVGTYIVTFDVSAAIGFTAAAGLPAGTITMDNPTPVADDYDINGTGTFTYTSGTTRPVTITPKENKSSGAVTILYNGTTATPTNAGTYTVTFNVNAAEGWNAAVGLSAGTIIINRAGGYTVSASTGASSVTGKGFTVNIVTAANGQVVEYAVSASSSVPSTGWQESRTFSGLAGATAYYIFARAKENTNYNTGEASISAAAVTTLASATVDIPTMSSVTGNSITVTAVTAPTNGQTVEYAVSTSSTAPSTGWQDGTTISGLTASVPYYIYARAKENTNYNAGPAQRSAAMVTTLHILDSVTANGSLSPKVKTTAITLIFSGNPGTINISDISLSGVASIGSATLSGSGSTRTLSPITLTGSNSTGSVTVTVSGVSGVQNGSKTVTVYNPLTAGLYATGSNTSVDLSSTSGTTIVEKSFNYINNVNPGTYTLMLDSDISVAGQSTAEISNGSASRHLKVTNAKLTIIGIDAERKISVISGSGWGIFAVGISGKTGIELTIGENITVVGNSVSVSSVAVDVVQGATFTMEKNASMSGNYGGVLVTHRAVSLGGNCTLIMQDNAKITRSGVVCSGNGNTITMSGSASIVDGVSGSNSSTITMSDSASVTGGVSYVDSSSNFTMSDNASVVGGVSGSNSTFNMSGSASVTGRVNIGSNSTFDMKDNASVSGNNDNGVEIRNGSKFTMQNNAKVNNSSNGVYVSGSGSEFIMSGNASVSNNSRGVYLNGDGTFTMQGNATVFNNYSTSNDGGGVRVAAGNSVATFTMKDNASVYGNTGNNGGGVYVVGSSSYKASFIMQDDASISGNTATSNATDSGGGGVYVGSYSTFEMKGGLIWGNKANGNSSNGGGVNVYNNGTFTMSGGTIYGSNGSTILRNDTGGIGYALYVNNSGSAKFADNTDITSPGSPRDTTITTGSQPTVKVTVTYNINGGTGTTPASLMVAAGDSITLNNGNGLTRTGYTFAGWNTSPSGTGTNYNAGTSYTPSGNITLYAKWNENTLTTDTWKDGNIPSSGSREEWFKFTATAATQYIHVSFGTLTYLYVQLYDSSGTTTVGNQTILYNGIVKYTSQSLTSGQVYYVKVTPYTSSYSGTYKIAFNTSSTAPAQ